ncbi:MAG: type II toxin-antitoxin system RelE/ParE family toxin [Chitinophagaceae bacterium]|jgi:plasmid stabilization system protein ParE
MKELKISPLALKDMQEAAKYYNRQQKGLGRRFETAIRQTFARIQEMPHAASISHLDIRYKVMDDFPFIITYRFDSAAIFIARIFHTHQNPESLL